MLTGAKGELADLQAEQQREMEGLLDNVRQLTRDLRLQMLVIDAFVPPEFQTVIEENVAWNEEIGEWQLKCVAYTGNNMRKRTDMEGGGNINTIYLYSQKLGAPRPFLLAPAPWQP